MRRNIIPNKAVSLLATEHTNTIKKPLNEAVEMAANHLKTEPEDHHHTKEKLKEIQISENESKTVDKFGTTRQLRASIEEKYQFIELVGKGSYGSVSKGKCKATGRTVALKIIEGSKNTEYDTIKLVREIQLMKRLNKVAKMYKSDKCHFVTELIDIIYPESQIKYVYTNTPETFSSDGSR